MKIIKINSSISQQIFARKFLKVVAFILFILGTGVSVSWFATFVTGIKTNVNHHASFNASEEENSYSFTQGAKDFSKAAVSYGCGLVALYSAVKIEQEIQRLSNL